MSIWCTTNNPSILRVKIWIFQCCKTFGFWRNESSHWELSVFHQANCKMFVGTVWPLSIKTRFQTVFPRSLGIFEVNFYSVADQNRAKKSVRIQKLAQEYSIITAFQRARWVDRFSPNTEKSKRLNEGRWTSDIYDCACTLSMLQVELLVTMVWSARMAFVPLKSSYIRAAIVHWRGMMCLLIE